MNSSQGDTTFTDVTGLSFPTSNVRSARIDYTIFRFTDTNTVYEFGSLFIVYSPGNSVSQKWEVQRDFVGDGKVLFQVTDDGQVQYKITSTIAGTNYQGKIGFRAMTILQA